MRHAERALTAALQPQHSQHEQDDEVGALLRMLTSAPAFVAEHELYSAKELRERIEEDMLEVERCGSSGSYHACQLLR